jgi:glycosyltransferase involved in cell wall biosynthesis
MAMKKFAFLSQAWPEDKYSLLSGSSVQVYQVSRELASRGYQILVICSAPGGNYISVDGRLRVINIPPVGKLRFLISRSWLSEVKKELKKFEPDVVYQRGKLPESIAAASYTRKTDALYIWLSNSDMSVERWKYARKRWAKKGKWLVLLPRLLEALLTDLMIEKAITGADVYIAQNEHQRKKLEDNFKFKATVLGSGYPVPPLRKKASIRPKVLWLANLTLVKRPWIFAELASALYDANAKFIMAGRAPDPKIMERILKITNKLPDFNYLGCVSLDEAERLIGEADIFILTSEYEGIPNTYIQASLNGVPTVSFFGDTKHNQLASDIGMQCRTFEEMVEMVRYWINNKEERLVKGNDIYESAKYEFDIKNVADKLIETIAGFRAGES